MLTISLRQLSDNETITVMVDEEQTISGTLKILMQAGMIENRAYHTVQSCRSKERIAITSTYRKGNIYNGDILLLKP
ncbi:MAG: hypothetical protein NC302_04915 [Bacteroidales bacterium]|nr:hypothetical protein [Bacteroidales bacterium]MCM1416363.1 hypothetical protein [bacterium]MCM1422638.1 hypothetical protein [bacterium]